METCIEPLDKLATPAGSLDTQTVFVQTANFVWRTLHRMGVPAADVEDVLQEVFVVVHRRLGSYDPSCQLTTWLFGICLKVANRHRRRAYFRRERWGTPLPDVVDDDTPEAVVVRRQARRLLEEALGRLSPEKRAVFVLFEIEGQDCMQIAELMGVPVGTVYSRLHAARRQVTAAGARLRGRQR